MSSILNQILGVSTVLAQVTSNVNGAVDKVTTETGNQFTQLVGSFLAAIPLWIAAIVIAFASYLVALIVKKSIEVKMAEKGIEEEHKEIQIVAGRTAYFVVLTIGLTISLSIVGIDLKPIVAAGAFGLGFALQDIIMNTISGMIILMSRHFTIGDVITVSGVTGRIEEIQTRATIIKAFDGTKVIVPNAGLFKNVVVSKTSNPFRKLSFIMGVGYGSDLKAVMELTLAVLKSIPGVMVKPKPSVVFSEWGDSSINFKINAWIESKGGKLVKVKNRIIMDLTDAYDEAGFDIPYPIQTIMMDKGDGPEFTKKEIKAKVKAIKARLKAKSTVELTPAAAVFASAPQQYLPAAQPVLAQPQPIMAEQQPAAVVAPVQQPVIATNTAPAPLPTAIETTPNSPGQSWLQQALAQQVAATAQPAPVQQPAPIQPALAITAQPTPVAQPTITTMDIPAAQPLQVIQPAPVIQAQPVAPAIQSVPESQPSMPLVQPTVAVSPQFTQPPEQVQFQPPVQTIAIPYQPNSSIPNNPAPGQV